VLDGEGTITGATGAQPLRKGQSWLLPAGNGPLVVEGDLRLLVSAFPE
jgi:mannose-6-phosphate isomerase class I